MSAAKTHPLSAGLTLPNVQSLKVPTTAGKEGLAPRFEVTRMVVSHILWSKCVYKFDIMDKHQRADARIPACFQMVIGSEDGEK